jgi:pyruvate,water dikinase
MGHDLAILAELARNEPEVATLIVSGSPEEALQRLREHPATHAFLTRFAEFLSRHGHRTAKEFEVQTPRWEENPSLVITMVRNYLTEPSMGLSRNPKHAEEAREKLEDRLLQSLSWRWPFVRFAARRARQFLKLRENSRFFHIMGFGVVRKKILTVEEELLRDGRVKCRGDIFFLFWPEVTALRSGSLQWLDVEERIQARRMEHVRLTKLNPRRTFGVETVSSATSNTASDDVLRGQGASPGSCKGVARVILDPGADVTLRPGEILVAPYADPAWAPLFLTAGAAVVEVGSYLSHAGTVAREYGMPFVVDVADCTRRLRTGMRVLVDGDQGIVRIIEGEPA